MSFEGQSHHPHTTGEPPRASFIHLNEGKSYIPEGLELVQAHWFVRHGERAPVRKRLTGLAGLPHIFPLCSIGKEFGQAVLTLDGNKNGRMEVGKLEGLQGQENLPEILPKNACFWGELTDLGRQSTLTLGSKLRSLYVDQLGFLPSKLPDVGILDAPVTFRSTPMPRTIETLHQIVEGLYPGQENREGKVEYTVRNAMDESLYPNSMCLRMRKLDRISADQAAKTYNPTLEPLDDVIGKYIDGPIRIDGHPRANGILDTIMVARAHGIPVPKEFNDVKVLEALENAVVHEWFDGYTNLEYKKLSMGRLIGDLGAELEKKIADPLEKENKLKMAIYACHDTSLGGILNALEAFSGRWPPFTSYISFELFRPEPKTSPPTFFSTLFNNSKSSPKPSEHFVRIKYNSKDVLIPACEPIGKHLEGTNLCTWDAFREAVKKVEITGDEWKKQCGSE